MTTLKEARAILRPLGIRIECDDGEYRVSYSAVIMRDPDQREDTAYYTPDLIDAIGTGQHMASLIKPKA